MRVDHVPFGRPATEALAGHVAAAQADDPLAPVTVVVPSNLAGLTARRLLASGELAPTSRGIANVTFTTPFQLAARLGGPRLAADDRLPLTDPVLGAAVRAELAAAPGPFASVADHHATEQAVAGLYSELSRARPATLEVLRRSSRPSTRAVVDLVAGVAARLRDRHDEGDLAEAACAALAAGDHAPLGTVVVHLVDDPTPAMADLLAELERQGDHVRLVGVVDHPAPVPSAVISVPDTDEEVRTALREVAEALEAGTPLDRIAVLHPAVEPYARTLAEQLEGAGIPFTAASPRPLSATVAGRTLLRVLDLVEGGMSRDGVVDLVAGAPVRTPSGGRAPAAAWDAVSRSAGVVGGAEDWVDKLERHIAASEEREQPNEVTLGHTRSLLEFVRWLAPIVDAARVPTTWSGRAEWAQRALGDLLGAEQRRLAWPEDEHQAALEVTAAVERSGALDELDPGAPFASFARALADELDRPAGRHGTFGHGVLVAPLAAAVGLDLDVVLVVGMSEGSVPSRPNEDPLLPDAERARAVDGELPLRRDQADREERLVHAALAAGGHRRVLIRPWGDHRKGRTRYPSRWCPDDGTDERPSFPAGLRSGAAPSSTADLDLRSLVRHVDANGDPADHPAADATVRAGLELARARASGAFTRFDGDLRAVDRPSPVEDRPFSASRLETWARCPRRYFLADELGLRRLDRPERITEISPLDQGTLVHEVLERFLGEVVERPLEERPGPGDRWSPADRRRLLALAEEVCAEVEAKGLTGRPLLWRLRREQLLVDFARFLDRDDRVRSEWGTTPEAVEQAFGMDGAPDASIPLADGRALPVRGKVDRVDRAADGTAVILDYKTGRLSSRSSLKELDVDPVVRGERMQLGLYAEAIAGDGPAAAWYWYATTAGGFETVGFRYGADERARFREVLTEIVAGIDEGLFPARSGDYNSFFRTHDQCGWCEFDDLCPIDRHETWVRMADEPALARYRALAEPQEPEA